MEKWRIERKEKDWVGGKKRDEKNRKQKKGSDEEINSEKKNKMKINERSEMEYCTCW